ncbi:GntR family transcriptional regulator [Lichenihabitans psoromatis]|uniref:GntR family transcriptional regulator n=1 Tax=Lichenihabitans psoromatis TaxID=2528642 RepID=UPI00103586CC|nr:GntR family transcriptional regulator [Lichenihabitans psoromatis]
MISAASSLGDRPAAAAKRDIFASIREAIVSRKLAPGMKLTEDVIADTFGCGRGPVRWALDRLQDEGLVTLVPNRGAFVAEPPLDEAKHLFGARRLLEGGIVRCLCGATSPNDLKPLIECVDAEDQAHAIGDEREALRLSGDFHLRMAAMTGNPIVETMLRELVSRTILAISTHQRADTSGCRNDEHRRLLALMAAGDIEGAVQEMEQHLVALEQGLDMTKPNTSAPKLRDVLRGSLAKIKAAPLG